MTTSLHAVASPNPGSLREAVTAECVALGRDPLLVQGAGGNVSWKEGDTLWVKASGTWLADAGDKDIFVPVDLDHLQTELRAGRFEVKPEVRGTSALRPSIETLLHALMPQRIVVHLHAIDVLARLVRADFETAARACLPQALRWTSVPYCKPGAPLAQAVAQRLAHQPADVVFLTNHGVVIGADSPQAARRVLDTLTQALHTPALPVGPLPADAPSEIQIGHQAWNQVPSTAIQALACDPVLYDHVERHWALYPDHVVFLGPRAHTFNSVQAAQHASAGEAKLVFIRGVGVYASPEFSQAQQTQLLCYANVVVRQLGQSVLTTLSEDEIGELLNWDAERYRMRLAK